MRTAAMLPPKITRGRAISDFRYNLATAVVWTLQQRWRRILNGGSNTSTLFSAPSRYLSFDPSISFAPRSWNLRTKLPCESIFETILSWGSSWNWDLWFGLCSGFKSNTMDAWKKNCCQGYTISSFGWDRMEIHLWEQALDPIHLVILWATNSSKYDCRDEMPKLDIAQNKPHCLWWTENLDDLATSPTTRLTRGLQL